MLLRSCDQSGEKDLCCHYEASSRLVCCDNGEVVKEDGQVKVKASVQDEMTKHRGINII